MNRRVVRRASQQNRVQQARGEQERNMPRLPGGFSLPPFGLHQWLALVIVCIALWAVGLLWLGLQASSAWTQSWQKDIRFHIYLDSSDRKKADAARLQALAGKLEALSGVAAVRVVPQQESRDWLNDWLGETGKTAGEMVDELLPSLPGTLEVRPTSGGGEFLYQDLADAAAAFGADINRGEAHLVQAQRLMAQLQSLLWFGTLVMGLAMVIIISNTLRMILLARADEVQLMRLLGADEWFVRLPFVLEGGLLGALAGLLAWLLLWPLLWVVGDWLIQLDIEVSVLVLLLPLLLGGALAGCLGALLATMRMASENTVAV
ncbi:MAG: FtsX-like permease family protein [Mariprofundaceae bacterium]|nr:FtsX-like permease family protein [Mariprofundaceae bacterium]